MGFRFIRIGWLLAILPAAMATAADSETLPAGEAFTTEQVAFFEKDVLPILEAKCIKCHGAEEEVEGGLRLTSRESILTGGDSGPAIDTESPSESVLLGAINYDLFEMPPTGKLPQASIDALTKWVEMGAPWSKAQLHAANKQHSSTSLVVDDAARAHWAYRPVIRPEVPTVNDGDWIQNPIDAFILEKLDESGMRPSPPAEKTALLRRVYYDLWGLPPSPDAVREFLTDDSPRAFEKVVDRLLESPHYGERWGRHWLDLVRFAETNSYERDGLKPFAWRYRDYVIDSFNEDKPYVTFVLEQLAGDELPDSTAQALIATGYYRLGIWDDEPADPEQALYDDLDDIANTTGQVFLGMTVGCGRCHDHKLDPFPQRDYYRFLAFFQGVQRYGVRSAESVGESSLRPLASAADRERHQQAVEEFQNRVAKLDQAIEEIENLVKHDFVPVEHEEFAHDQNREPLLEKRVPKILSKGQFEEYVALRGMRKDLENQRPPALEQALCVTEVGPIPRDTHILARGNPHVPGDMVSPGFPSVLTETEPEIPEPTAGAATCGRRLVLARWIASADNPLTPRVIANRVWQYHFGRGIVRSSNNFGPHGDRPTHPQLLDWLASEFVSHGWHFKHLHKLILMSNAYQMSSKADKAGLEKDPLNDLLWRFDMRRLSAEEIRDTLLSVNGTLNPKMGGPGFYSKIPAAVLAGQSRPGDGWGESPAEERARRSVYIHVKRSLVTPILASFDLPENDATCPARFVSTQPTQALGMLNSDFIHEEAGKFASLVAESAGIDTKSQVELALKRAFQREPTETEIRRGVELIERLRAGHQKSREEALRQFCLTVYNLNEFMYLD